MNKIRSGLTPGRILFLSAHEVLGRDGSNRENNLLRPFQRPGPEADILLIAAASLQARKVLSNRQGYLWSCNWLVARYLLFLVRSVLDVIGKVRELEI